MAAKFADILNAIRARLVRKSVVPLADRVIYWAKRSNPPHLTGDKDIVLRLKGISSPQDIVAGAGRQARAYRNLEVTYRTRISRDRYDSDEIWLVDADDGLLAFEEAGFDALQMYQGENADGSVVLLGEPMRLLTSSDPDREMEAKGQIEGWGASSQIWQIMFEPDIDQTWQ